MIEHCEECGDILETVLLPNGWTECECHTCEKEFSVDDQGYRVDK